MQGKLFQFDDALRHEIVCGKFFVARRFTLINTFQSTSSLALYPNEIKSLEETFEYLALVTSTPPVDPPAPLSSTHVDAIISIFERWPSSQRFPGMGPWFL